MWPLQGPLTPSAVALRVPRGSLTCPSKAATLAVLTTSPRWPSASGLFWLMSCALRRITLKVPTRFTWGREMDLGRGLVGTTKPR